MPRRVGEVTDQDLDQAWDRLHQVRTSPELEALIESTPTLRSPLFHAMYRGWHSQLEEDAREEQRPLYDAFFTILHYRQFHALLASPPSEPVPEVAAFIPPYFERVLELLDGCLPPPEGPALDPVDGDAVARELSALLGREVTVPEYSPSQGSVWGIVLVVCAACGAPFLTCRTQLVNLLQAPDLLGPARAGRINATRCPRCGGGVVKPVRLWIHENPVPRDPLAALSCCWVIGVGTLVYQPVPGTGRDPEFDRVQEIRFMQQLDDLEVMEWLREREPPGGVAHAMGVAYTLEELISRYDRVNTPAAEDGQPRLPYPLEVMIEDLTRKVAHGFAPLGMTIATLRERPLCQDDWPIAPMAHAAAGGRETAIRAVIMNVIAEECARARGLNPTHRAVLAMMTVQALVALNEHGLAEAPLASLVELAAQVEDPEHRDRVRLAALLARAEVAQALGRSEESYRLREEVEDLRPRLGGRMGDEIHRLQEQSSRAVLAYATGRFVEAVRLFPPCLRDYEALIRTLAARPGPDKDGYLFAAEHSLSGAQSNWANVLLSLARHQQGLPVRIRDGREYGVDGALGSDDSPEAQAELDAALDMLQAAVPGCDTPEAIREAARQGYERALEISTRVEGWEFAGIQAANIGNVHADAGHDDEARRYHELAVDYAGQAGDHERVVRSRATLARLAVDAGDGPGALAHYQSAAREAMHLAAGAGRLVHEQAGLLEMIAVASAETVAHGGDPATAFLVAETLKAFPTALALRNATPGRHRPLDTANAVAELARRREALRLQAIWAPDDPGEIVRQLAETEEAISAAEHQARLRDPEYLRWLDATGLEVARPRDILRLLDQVGPGTMLMGLVHTGPGLWTYLLGEDGCTYGYAEWPESDDLSLEGFAELILGPHVGRLRAAPPSTRVLVSPGDRLAWIPIAGLPLDGAFLCEHVTPVHVQSGEVLEAALGRPVRGYESIACLGDPSRLDATPLPGARREAELIAELFHGEGRAAVIRTGDQATISALRELAPTVDVIHVACHASGDLVPHHLARLLLAPDLLRGDSGDLTDGRVLSDLMLRPGCLVNLAACSSGGAWDHQRQLPRGFVGAFLYAGAGAVLASLWPLEDRAAALFQSAFYTHLLQGARPAESLVLTQRMCISGELGPRMQESGAWAGYVIYGTA